MKPLSRNLLMLSALWLVAGCQSVSTPKTKPAQAPVPQQYSELSKDWKPAEPKAHLPRSEWWTLLADPALDELERKAGKANQQLAAAAARLEQSRALINVARSGLFPHVTAGAEYTRNRSSYSRPLDGRKAGHSENYNDFLLPLEAGWEADLWGRVRQTVTAQQAQSQAAQADLESLKLAIHAEVAVNYVSLRTVQHEEALLKQTLDVLRKSLNLTQNRRAGGIASDLDVAEAEALVRKTESQIPSLELQRTRLLHALATLCGETVQSFKLPETSASAKVPILAIGIPSELLERRPDIASAEARMQAANAQVGIAQTAFYPSLRLQGLAGFQSVELSSLLGAPSHFWAVGPTLSVPIFQGGQNRANLAASKAAYEATVADYRQTVLGAFQEVEDQLAAQQLLERQAQAQEASLTAVHKVVEVAQNRYKTGLITYLEVATALENSLARERELVQTRGEQMAAAISLIKALGGGWEATKTR